MILDIVFTVIGIPFFLLGILFMLLGLFGKAEVKGVRRPDLDFPAKATCVGISFVLFLIATAFFLLI